MPEEAEQSQSTPEHIGVWLRAEREKRHLSIKTIAQATKIRPATIEALEAGEFSHLPLPYIRASIRTIARFLKIPSEEVNRALETYLPSESVPAPSVPASSPIDSAPSTRWIWLAIAVILSLGILFLWQHNSDNTPVTPPPASQTGENVSSTIRNAESSELTITLPPTTKHRTDTLIVEAITTDSVWVSLLFDNHRRWQELLPPRKKRVWGAKHWIRLSVGNAGGLLLIVNGDTLGYLGKPGVVLKNIKITPRGIEPF